MSKDVNRDSVKLRTINRNNAQNNISKNENVSARLVNNKSAWSDNKNYVDNSQNRLNRLKHAIGSGRFRINSTKVAEKLILFETQLTT